jgi:hypothetical protein
MKKSIIILVLILVSCGSKKTTTSVTTLKATSAETKYVSLPIETNYSVGLECDSLGRIKPVNYLKSSGSFADSGWYSQIFSGTVRLWTGTDWVGSVANCGGGGVLR